MNQTLALVAAITAVNPARLHPALPAARENRKERLQIAAIGALTATVGLGGIALVAQNVNDALDVSAATTRIAVGVVLLLSAGRDFFATPISPVPSLISPPLLSPSRTSESTTGTAGTAGTVKTSLATGLVPLAFPLLLAPGLGLLTMSASIDEGVFFATAAAAFALSTVVGSAFFPSAEPESVLACATTGAARFCAALLLLCATGLIVDGIFDI